MDALSLLSDEIFSLPKKFGKETTFLNFLDDFYTKYKKSLNGLKNTDINIESLVQHCDKLLESLKAYYNGYIQKSYSLFLEAMELVKQQLFPEKKGSVARIIGLEEPFYRARIGSNKLYTREQMFHRSFNEREYASTERFSIPGLPCLYLSNSIYVCWEELNRPSINEFFVSRFQQENHNLEILDISLTPNNVILSLNELPDDGEFEGYKNKFCLSFIIKWPLIISCSISVFKEDAPFKPEYIFPQFLLQWN